MLKELTGVVRRDRKAISKEKKNTQSCRLRIRMRSPMRNGRANVCPPRQSLNLLHAGACQERFMYGVMSFALAESGWRTHGRESFPSKMRAKTAMLASPR